MDAFEQTLGQLRAMGEMTRLRTLVLLRAGELTVTELTEILGQSQPRVSRHLKVLAEAGLVDRFQEGAWVFYRLADQDALGSLEPTLDRAARAMPDEDRAAFDLIRSRRAALASSYFAAHAAEWDDLRSRHVAEGEVEIALLGMIGQPIDSFLDLGTGTGRMLSVFRDHYRRGIGLDLSPEMLMIARARLLEEGVTHAHIRRADFLEDELPEGVDVVCLHHVLHYLTAPEKAVAVAAEALAPGGSVLIADFAPHAHEDLRELHAHRRLGFDDAEISEWGRRHGLEIEASRSLAAPVADGIDTRLWCLKRRGGPVHFSHRNRDAHVDA